MPYKISPPPTGSLPTFFAENRNTGRTFPPQVIDTTGSVATSPPITPTSILPVFPGERRNSGISVQSTESAVKNLTVSHSKAR